MGQSRTIVHLVRHGEVHNPAGLLYGRLPDYHLSERGREMAERVADYFRHRDVVHIRSSPLERRRRSSTRSSVAGRHRLGVDPCRWIPGHPTCRQ